MNAHFILFYFFDFQSHRNAQVRQNVPLHVRKSNRETEICSVVKY